MTMQGVIDQSLIDLGDDGDVPFDWQLLDGSEVPAATRKLFPKSHQDSAMDESCHLIALRKHNNTSF